MAVGGGGVKGCCLNQSHPAMLGQRIGWSDGRDGPQSLDELRHASAPGSQADQGRHDGSQVNQ